jgi:hypothetical protein
VRRAAPSRAALAEVGPASAGRARVAAGLARAVRVGRADAAGMGHARYATGPSANSAQRTRLNFINFLIYSILCKFKNLCRIRLNSKNYETNFVGNV